MTDSSTATQYLRLHPDDDVVIALADLALGASVEEVSLRQPVPNGHKVATRDIAIGEQVRKLGQIIGFATTPILGGDHVHSHNLATDNQNLTDEFGNDRT